MAFYQLKICYQGTAYSGWQIQPKDKTVQSEVNQSLARIAKVDESLIYSLGASRTDAGVHALAQIVKIEIPLEIELLALKRALNANLPADIRCLEIHASSVDFMPITMAQKKEYRYLFTNDSRPSIFVKDLTGNCPFPLDFDVMGKACKLLVGRHDFQNFFCTGTPVRSTVREIFECRLEYCENLGFQGEIFPSHWAFVIEGNGFLKQMVRLLMGTIWEVGRGKVSLAELQDALCVKKEKKLGPTAPASGLYLARIDF